MFNRTRIRSHTLFFKTENAELHWKQFPVDRQKDSMVMRRYNIEEGEKQSEKRSVVTSGVGRDPLAKFFSKFGHFTADGFVSAQQPVIGDGVKLRNTRRHILVILREINTYTEINKSYSTSVEMRSDRSEPISSHVLLDTKRSSTSPSHDKTCTPLKIPLTFFSTNIYMGQWHSLF